MEIAIGIICAVMGVALGFLLGRNRKRESELEAQVKVLESANATLREQAIHDKEESESRTSPRRTR